ncbi:tyrosine-type recombinase/integrase [Saccharopolyspora erythraea]|uniref:Site-specific recombinase, phage integrase family n=2 Tax=Saccharopolyspora erythraea TaxID=1836 RepID=A4FJX6_SACEN|nr:tyrosine-type recombinase/integrase [Saccharopolyspora erythraea]CAM04351.1 site-specific recombinase, phage integrase family [Saccharopolyspora erythraea NRRL 2338]
MDLERITDGLSVTWAGYLRDWDRSLRSGNRPETTRYNYVLAAAQLARYLAEHAPDPEADAAAEDPAEVAKAHIEAFQAWMIETRSAATAVNKHKALQQLFKWLMLDEEEIDRSPMERVRLPKAPTKLVPVLEEEATTRLLEVCKGKDFLSLRDQAIIRLFCNTGARLAEVAHLRLEDVDLKTESVTLYGKGGKVRRVRMGARTARALSRYLRARAKRKGADLPNLWLADRGGQALNANGIKIRLKRLGQRAGLDHVHAHRWRHTYAHQWKRAGGDTGDLMLLLGWSSDAMPRHYGASAAAERAQESQVRMGIGDDV